MTSKHNSGIRQICSVFVVFFTTVNSIYGQRFREQNYYPTYYDGQDNQLTKIQVALSKLSNEPHWVPDWPDSTIKMGQVAGLALDTKGLLHVFHRGSHVWGINTFNNRQVYQGIGESYIPHPTILVFNDTGDLVDMWGQNLFHMPHGITIDKDDNVWLTDVALHQVFKFTAKDRLKPAMVLGEKFEPGDDDEHFCKPSAVAVMSNGEFFVADGYCNTRIIKYSPDGTKLLQWGRSAGSSPFVFNVPHALALAEDRGLVCVADREHGRASCFRTENGTYEVSFSNWLIGPRLFSLAYAPVQGGRLYVVNGPAVGVPVRGYVLDMTSGRLLATFAPPSSLRNPHDIAVSPDGSKVYVAEINPYKVHKFIDESLIGSGSEVKSASPNGTLSPAKPTATVELQNAGASGSTTVEGVSVGGNAWEAWRGAIGGALGALAAALTAAAGLALLRARSRGRKGVTRRHWEYGQGEFKLRRLLERRRFTRVHSDESDDEPAPMLPPHPPANA